MDERKEWSLAENVVAGEILTSPVDVIPRIRKIVNASDFQNNATRAIYSVAVILISNGKPCDYLQIQAEAKKMGIELTDDYIYSLMQLTITTGNAEESAKIVHESAISRKGMEIGSRLASGELSPSETIKSLNELLSDRKKTLDPPMVVANRVMDFISEVASGKKKQYIPTGISTLDYYLGGLIKGGLITIAARPGTGKTTAALNIAENVSRSNGTVLYFSLEMTEEQIWVCRAANVGGINRSEIDRGTLDENGWRSLTDAFNVLSQRPFYVRDKPSTLEDIEREAMCMDNLSLIVVDHIGLIKPTIQGSRYELMTKAAIDLKQLALNLKVPIIGLCQLNRKSEERENKRPTMSDLRDSGAVEENSDVVALLFRKAQYLPPDQQPKAWDTQDIEFIVDKNRHGMTGTAVCNYCGANSRITEKANGY